MNDKIRTMFAAVLSIGLVLWGASVAHAEEAPATESSEVVVTEQAPAPEVVIETAEPVDTAVSEPVAAEPVGEAEVPEAVKTGPPAPITVGTVLWEVTSPTDDVFLTDQEFVAQIDGNNTSFWVNDSTLKCNTKYQADAYPKDKIAALIADGLLKGGEDSAVVLNWNVFTTAPCPVIVPPAAANPAASIVVDCLFARVTLTNELGEAAERLTASAVVYVDGHYWEALSALGGESVTGSEINISANTGGHRVSVRTGPAFGDILLSEVGVATDPQSTDAAAPCYVPPVIVEPETPAVTPVDNSTPPTRPDAVNANVDQKLSTLAYTGASANFIGDALVWVMYLVLFGAMLLAVHFGLRKNKARTIQTEGANE